MPVGRQPTIVRRLIGGRWPTSGDLSEEHRAIEVLPEGRSNSYRAKGGERGCTGQQFENATPGDCYHWPAGAAFLCSTKVCA
jgi:hypothetical protein